MGNICLTTSEQKIYILSMYIHVQCTDTTYNESVCVRWSVSRNEERKQDVDTEENIRNDVNVHIIFYTHVFWCHMPHAQHRHAIFVSCPIDEAYNLKIVNEYFLQFNVLHIFPVTRWLLFLVSIYFFFMCASFCQSVLKRMSLLYVYLVVVLLLLLLLCMNVLWTFRSLYMLLQGSSSIVQSSPFTFANTNARLTSSLCHHDSPTNIADMLSQTRSRSPHSISTRLAVRALSLTLSVSSYSLYLNIYLSL